MKKIALGLMLLVSFSVAKANSLSIIAPTGPFSIKGYDGQPANVTGVKKYGTAGTLSAGTAGTISFTYLGNESGYLDSFKFNVGGSSLTESNPLGTTISKVIGAGSVGFSFMDDVNKDGTVDHTFSNGSTSSGAFGYAFLMNSKSVFAHNAKIGNTSYIFDYILGFNDSYITSAYSRLGDADYDDYVVGVKFTPTPSAVPLPAAAWLFGSALFGFISLSNRRKI